jgi:hypothetical protein
MGRLSFVVVALCHLGCGDNEESIEACMTRRTAFEAGLPLPVPLPGRYVVQLVNETDVTLLAGTTASHRVGEPPKPALPRENTWILPAKGTLTIDIPEEWERAIGAGATTPVFWARTGCRYDVASDIAQCETGTCGGFYDCSKANQTTAGAKSYAEWTFDDRNHLAAPDISAVDGVNINMDIVPVGPHQETPGSYPVAPQVWLGGKNLPLTQCGRDMRKSCPREFQLRREQLAFVPDPTPDVVACFSNCGNYKFSGDKLNRPACPPGYRCPGEPDFACNADPAVDPTCFYWKAFCCAVPAGDPEKIYTQDCTASSQCKNFAGCWDTIGKCACIAYNKEPNCPADVCTNSYDEAKSNQPPFGLCSQLTDKTGRPQDCIGDDTLHKVMPRGLTWPNDPQTYYSDAKAYRIVFAPGGTTVPISESKPIPMCKDLPATYDYEKSKMLCANDIAQGAVFAGARLTAHGSWSCKVMTGDTQAVLCRW